MDPFALIARTMVRAGVYRLMRRWGVVAVVLGVLGASFFLAATDARAEGTVAKEVVYEYRVTTWPWMPTPAQACSQPNPDPGGVWSYNEALGRCDLGTGGAWAPLQSRVVSESCPANSTLVAAACMCNANFAPNAGATACVFQGGPGGGEPQADSCLMKAGRAVAEELSFAGKATGEEMSACLDGCKVTGMGLGVSVKKADGSWMTYVPPSSGWKQAGEVCTSGQAQAAPAPCKATEYKGTVNGVQVCVPGTETEEIREKEEIKPSPSPGGEAIKEKTREVTNCKDGKCVTSKETTSGPVSGGGGTTKTESKTENPASFCKENPTSPLCKAQESSWGGSCTSGFACKGDAVECAIAREVHVRACQFHAENELSAIGVAAMAASGPALSASAIQFSLADRISETPTFGADGGCPQDAAITTQFGSVTIPFSHMCGSLEVISIAMRGLALLVAGFIVFRRK